MKSWFLLVAAAIGLAGAAPPPSPDATDATVEAPPSIRLDGLFQEVAKAEWIGDGKSWVDARAKRPVADILRDWHAQRAAPGFDLRRFVADNFEPAAPYVGRAPTKGLTLRAHIADLWPILTRAAPAGSTSSSLLPLPHPYVVPGGRFIEAYYWDSYFTMLGMGPAQAGLRRGMIDNFADLITRYGHVPNGNRSYYLSRSQPPFFFKMVELTGGSPASADARYLPALQAEYRFWMKGAATLRPGTAIAHVVRLRDGSLLNRYWDERDVPRDESYASDARTAAASGRAPASIYRDLRAGAESGWDFSSRWLGDHRSLPSIETSRIVPVDLNSLLYGLEEAIAAGCAASADHRCARSFAGKAKARARAMRTLLWNGRTGLYDDYDWQARTLLGNVSAAALYPLFVGLATKTEADSTATIVERRLLKPGGLVTTDRQTGQQWDAPNGWAPLQWIAVVGLRRYGEAPLARQIATRWLTTVGNVYADTGKLLEKYDVVTARPGGGGEYPLQDGFGWTNGTTIALMDLYPDALPAERTARR